MSILWLIAGFVICLFMPQSIQMVAKTFIASAYKSIRDKFSGNK